MADIRKKVFDNIRFNRITSGRPWRFAHRQQFLLNLNRYDKDSFDETIEKLFKENILELQDDDNDNYYLTQFGEDIVYEGMDNCFEKIVDYLIDNEYKENYLLTIQLILSIKANLNPIEEKHLLKILDELINKGVLVEDNFGYRLTSLGEKYLKSEYNKR